MPAYAMFLIRASHDVDALTRYRKAAHPTITAHGGRVRVARGRQTPLEGQPPPETVIVEFDSYEQALAWYRSPEYQAANQLRKQAADVDAWIVDGVAPPSV